MSDTMPVLHQNRRGFIIFFMGFLVMIPLGKYADHSAMAIYSGFTH